MTSSQRIKKVNEVIKKELGRIILKEIGFPRNILVTLTEVETTKDLRECKVFVSVVPEKETINVLKTLGKEIYDLQQILNQRLEMRPVPKIRFLEDKEFKEAQKVEKILDRIQKDNQA
ncbi:30S ribosome-binding factor RbfA [Patescibacteria group bacterium]|nr:30S ribosome-binding factor RbfA [Patescibacteria group bacterium]